MGEEGLGLFIIENGKKINSENYIGFLLQNLFLKEKTIDLKNMIFMQDNAPAHNTKKQKHF